MIIVFAEDLQIPEIQREMRVRFPGLDMVHVDNHRMFCRSPICHAPTEAGSAAGIPGAP
jgi:hypothetical protein